MVQQVFTTSSEDLLHLRACEFDVAFAIDKSPAAAAICESVRVGERRGFAFDGLDLAVIPYNKEATELWDIGLDNLLKFEVNRKPESQLLAEALKLPYRRDDYQVFLSTGEQSNIENLHRAWSENGHYLLVGINTGCSRTIAAKKLSLSGYIQLIEKLLVRKRWRVVLLGGPEDTIRNQRLANLFPEVILTPTENGLREGLVSVGACDTIITGDSLGMHMGIALKKWVVPWFGPTCGHEIDLFDRGMAIYSAAKCSPCWRRSCHEPVMCYDQVDFSQICEAVAQGEVWHKSQIYSFKQHSLEICS
jgi:heptosyltransferase-2